MDLAKVPCPLIMVEHSLLCLLLQVLPIEVQVPRVWLPVFLVLNTAIQWTALRTMEVMAQDVAPAMEEKGTTAPYEHISQVTATFAMTACILSQAKPIACRGELSPQHATFMLHVGRLLRQTWQVVKPATDLDMC